VEGQDIAPDGEDGWLKIAEILLSPGMTEVPPENIRNVTAIYQGEENAEWTNQKTRTFSLGSTLELKTILALEHTVTGKHREKVIQATNIDFGTGGNQVNAKKIPLGEGYTIDTDEFNAQDSIFASLIKEVGYRHSNVAGLIVTINAIIEAIADIVHEAPNDGAIYGRKNKNWVEVTGGGGGGDFGDAILALKFYSKKTLMITNARIVDRRKHGRDIGIPYLSATSRVYHFDTDLNDQNQKTNIKIAYEGEEPKIVSAEDTNGEVYFNPAVLAIPPYEMKGRSLYGNFSLNSNPETLTKTFTAEAWIRLFDERSMTVFRMGSGMESVVLCAGTKGAPECEYSGAEQDGIAYSDAEEPIGYSEAEADGIEYSGSEGDNIEYSGAEAQIGYSEAGTDPGNIVIHKWLGGEETVSLDDEALLTPIPKKTWMHIAAVSTPDIIAFYIGDRKIEFEKKSEAAGAFSLMLNPTKNEFNVDELLLDETAAIEFEEFAENTGGRVPYAALDHREKWFVLEAQSPDKVKTNLFETEQFRAAVQAVIDSNTQGV
jgi:hypothetical protein